jgi:hypothetical protein
MTDTMTFQNIDLSSWDTLYKENTEMHGIPRFSGSETQMSWLEVKHSLLWPAKGKELLLLLLLLCAK